MPRPRSGDVVGKPRFSYVFLCALAIKSQPEQKATLSEIYQFIKDNFPYYKRSDAKWQNSLRHNLSYNDCFVKVPKTNGGKGNYWKLHSDCSNMFENGTYQRRKKRFKADGREEEIDCYDKKHNWQRDLSEQLIEYQKYYSSNLHFQSLQVAPYSYPEMNYTNYGAESVTSMLHKDINPSPELPITPHQDYSRSKPIAPKCFSIDYLLSSECSPKRKKRNLLSSPKYIKVESTGRISPSSSTESNSPPRSDGEEYNATVIAPNPRKLTYPSMPLSGQQFNPQMSNSLPQMSNSLPQMSNSLPQMSNSLPQMSNSLHQMSYLSHSNVPQSSNSFYDPLYVQAMYKKIKEESSNLPLYFHPLNGYSNPYMQRV